MASMRKSRLQLRQADLLCLLTSGGSSSRLHPKLADMGDCPTVMDDILRFWQWRRIVFHAV